MKPAARSFHDPVYRVTYFVVISAPQDFRANLKKLTNAAAKTPAIAGEVYRHCTHTVDDCNGRCWRLRELGPDKRGHAIVIFLKAGVDVAIVAHEAWHAVFWLFADRGVIFDDGADEPVAYYLTWLIRSCLGITAKT